MLKYAREMLRDVEGYVPGEQPTSPDVIKLNTNENPYPPAPGALEAVRNIAPERLRKYPDPLAVELRALCAERYGYPGPEWVIAGNGMDEVLAMTIRTFMDPGDALLTTYPTYTLYETLARLHGAEVREVQLDEQFQLTDEFYRTPARVCFLPRPNAPSGICPPRAAVERLCGSFDGLVVIDEAYVDFADDDCMDFPKRFENAIVMRTFSKSFSLAGIRLGIAVARPEIIAEFLKTKDSYNVNALTQAAGVAAMRDYDHMRANAERIRTTRKRARGALQAMGFRVPESQSNFLLAVREGQPSAKAIFEALKERHIYVRYFDAPRLRDALRITIGDDREMDALLDALGRIVRQ